MHDQKPDPGTIRLLIQVRWFALWLAFERPDSGLLDAANDGNDAYLLAYFKQELERCEASPTESAIIFTGILQDIGLSPLEAVTTRVVWGVLSRLAQEGVDRGLQISTSDLLKVWKELQED